MPRPGQLNRREIVSQLSSALKPLPYVRAFWEGGAAAFGRVDAWSDIDLYILTVKGKTRQAFSVVERTLSRMSPISLTLTVPSGWEGVEQKFYKLRRASEFLVVDLAVLTESSPEKFLAREIHGNNVFYIDRDDVKSSAPLDAQELRRAIVARRSKLRERTEMFGNYATKELKRGNALEALEDYRTLVLGALVELLRMKYNPVHYNFRMRYVHHELPTQIVKRLERLSFVKDERDLAKKDKEAERWVSQLLRDKSIQ